MLENYIKIWEKISNLIDRKFDSEPVYGDYIKTKVKMYGDKINTIFRNNKIPKQNVSYKCLPVIMLDSVIRTNKRTFLKHFWKNVYMR